jgi:hypothetical protein
LPSRPLRTTFVLTLSALALATPAQAAELSGRVTAGKRAVAGSRVTLRASGEQRAKRLGAAVSDARGRFTISYSLLSKVERSWPRGRRGRHDLRQRRPSRQGAPPAAQAVLASGASPRASR